jgi:hypothetical protein
VVEDSVNGRNNDVAGPASRSLALTNMGSIMPKIDSTQRRRPLTTMNWLRNNDPNRPTWTIRQPGAGEPCWATHARPSVSEEKARSG